MKGAPIWPDIVALVVKAPRSVAELVNLTGAHENTVLRVLHQLRDEALIEPARTRERPHAKTGPFPLEWRWAI